MKKLSLLLVLFTVISCSEKTATTRLNGYWEIKTVILPDGQEKEFPASATVDYFEFKGNKGFRKKVMPQFDGTYMASNASEAVEYTEKDGHKWLNYTTQYSKWQEELISVDDDELVIKNTHGMEYHYTRPQNFTLKEDGKTAE
ncbi:hypothetical protein AM493_20135 [Flavobacterium akiainvivens]|uniref:Lipocalin-like domain-containing protein n=1 Tax=Flavobacterium akiainvivens TaxID=1202724 RepID=A0A0M8MLP1_9FLAO|nr:lipocalin family protein [Flavobacterium akiainvivens]KOS08098.1 hypothetical protein AM493_20135 [Flavobacterium akiainvivens]SFQ71831.1 Lipocalin-like domain-containing protein [Flavobacterium akiainvivens]